MQKVYTTDTQCPNCTLNVFQSLVDHISSEGGRDFEIECPQCHRILSISVEPVPAFTIAVDEEASKKLYKERMDFNKSLGHGEPPTPRIG